MCAHVQYSQLNPLGWILYLSRQCVTHIFILLQHGPIKQEINFAQPNYYNMYDSDKIIMVVASSLAMKTINFLAR